MTDQFTTRYRITPRKVSTPAGKRKCRIIENETLEKLSERPGRPEIMDTFSEMITSSPGKEKFRVGFSCNLVPWEILEAMDFEWRRTDCGNSGAVPFGEDIIHGEVCPLVKSTLGECFAEEESGFDLHILPATCDAKRKSAEILGDSEDVFIWNIPLEQDYGRYGKQTVLELKRLISLLEKKSSSKLKRKKLLETIRLSNRITAAVREAARLKLENPSSISYADLLLAIQTFMFSHISPHQWLSEFTKIIDHMKENSPASGSANKKNLVLTGAPLIFPNYRLILIAEESGAEIVSDTLCSGLQSLYDPVVIDEKSTNSLLRALINRSVFASICPCFHSQETKLNRILELAEEKSVDGFLHHSLRLCQLFDMELYRLEKILKERKIPVQSLRTDYSEEDTEQLRVRLEAFIETLFDKGETP